MCPTVVRNRRIDLSSYHSPSLFVYYSFDSPALLCEVKYQKGPSSAISGWMTLGIEGRFLCVQVVRACASMIVNMCLFGIAGARCVYLNAFASAGISNHNYAFFLLATYENTLNTITDGCVSSERWFKSNISKERVTVERAGGPNGCLSCHKSSPGCDEGKSISTVGHQVSVYYVMALSRAITINHFNWSAALQSMGFKWRLFNH